MMRFEDLDVWKRAARLSADIYKQLRDVKHISVWILAIFLKISVINELRRLLRYQQCSVD